MIRKFCAVYINLTFKFHLFAFWCRRIVSVIAEQMEKRIYRCLISIERIEIFIRQRNDRGNRVLARVVLVRRYPKTSIIRCKRFSGRRAATTRDDVDAANNEESSVGHSLFRMNIHGAVAFVPSIINYVIVWIIWQRVNDIKSTRRINNYFPPG